MDSGTTDGKLNSHCLGYEWLAKTIEKDKMSIDLQGRLLFRSQPEAPIGRRPGWIYDGVMAYQINSCAGGQKWIN
jgi:hypothetical protein